MIILCCSSMYIYEASLMFVAHVQVEDGYFFPAPQAAPSGYETMTRGLQYPAKGKFLGFLFKRVRHGADVLKRKDDNRHPKDFDDSHSTVLESLHAQLCAKGNPLTFGKSAFAVKRKGRWDELYHFGGKSKELYDIDGNLKK